MTAGAFSDSLRSYVGWSRGSVTSWTRRPERNKLVGGNAESRHLLSLAADVVYAPNPRPNLATAKRQAAKLGLRLIREKNKVGNFDHDHLQAL